MSSSFEPPSPALTTAIERWHRYLNRELPCGLAELLDDDVVMYSPIVFTPQHGKEVVKLYLDAAGQSFGGDNDGADSAPNAGRFHYTKQIAAGDTAILEFETSMSGKHVNGVDIITVNDEAKITEFRVMIRPLQAVNEVHRRMERALEALAGGTS